MHPLISEIPVIYFHSVAPAKNWQWSRHFLTLELRYFEEFLRYLKKNRWETILLEEYHEIKKNGKRQYPKVCCLTFDDGFLDNFIYAFPLLKKYGFNATFFVSPDFVDSNRPVARTLEDTWDGGIAREDIEQWGYLSWEEMRVMQESGIIDIQGHTCTHTKYFVSDELVSLHYPGSDCIYPVGNLFPRRKPGYITDPEFETLIPFGTPFFYEQSAVVARRVFINEDFNKIVVESLKTFNWARENAVQEAVRLIMPEYERWKKDDKIIYGRETENEYKNRVKHEIVGSKTILEEKLNKKIKFLCWPHGENNAFCHDMALQAGYLMTTTGKAKNIVKDDNTRIGERVGINFRNSFNKVKTISKIKALSGIFPYSQLMCWFRKI